MVLLEVRLEGGSTIGALRLVTESGTRVEVQVVIVGGDLVLTLLHAPEYKGDATEKEDTANTANDTADDLLVGVAQAAPVVSAVRLRRWGVGVGRLASCDGY
jgi:hypothetical protein